MGTVLYGMVYGAVLVYRFVDITVLIIMRYRSLSYCVMVSLYYTTLSSGASGVNETISCS